MEPNDGPVDEPPTDGRFEVRFHGLAVELILHPLAEGMRAPDADTLVAVLEGTPVERVNRAAVVRALDELANATEDVHVPAGSIRVPRGILEPFTIMVSHDGLSAYAVPTAPPTKAPPTPDAADAADADADAADADAPDAGEPDTTDAANLVTTAMLRRQLADERVTVGVIDAIVEWFGEGKPLPDTTCVAHGTDPVPGRDAELTYHFDPHPRLIPRELDDGSIDYHTLLVERFVEERTVLVTRTPAVMGEPGRDVHGRRVDVPSVRNIDLKDLAGQNTTIEGEELIATIGGRPVQGAMAKIEVLPVFEVKGDLNYGVGNIDFPGDVVIRGDVRPGFSVRAGGSVAIRGFVEGGSVIAGQDLAVAGVVGEQTSRFEVGGDLAAGYLHTTNAEVAGTATVRREIVNCTLTASRVQTSSSGRIVGGEITATTDVDAGVIGAPNGLLTEISVTSREPTATIRARRAAYPGAVMRVAGVRRQLEDALGPASFWDVAGTVVSLPVGIDEEEVRKLRESPSAA